MTKSKWISDILKIKCRKYYSLFCETTWDNSHSRPSYSQLFLGEFFHHKALCKLCQNPSVSQTYFLPFCLLFHFLFFALFYFVTKILVVNTFTHFPPFAQLYSSREKLISNSSKFLLTWHSTIFRFFRHCGPNFKNGQYKNWNSIIQTSTITYKLDSNTTFCSNLWSKLKIFLWQKIKFNHLRGKNLKVHKFTREWP